MLGFWPIGSAAIGDDGFSPIVVDPSADELLTPARRIYQAKAAIMTVVALSRSRVISVKE